MVAAANDGIFGRLCVALGLDDMALDRRFLTNALRVEHRRDLFAALDAATQGRTTAEVEQQLVDASVPCARIRDTGEVLECPQLEASGMLQSIVRPDGTDFPDFALPMAFDGERLGVSRPPPRLGEHTEEVLGALP